MPPAARACTFVDRDSPQGQPSRAQSPQDGLTHTQNEPAQENQPPPERPVPEVEQATPLDFELLSESKPTLLVDEAAVRRRRLLLSVHQGLGLGMFALSLGNTILGQLNYSDRFASGPSTGRYQLAHRITAYGTLVTFARTGLLALFAPTPLPKAAGFDRVSLHKVAMGAVTLGMAAEAVLGIWTASREGYLNQPELAAAHLAIGYFTFAAISLGVGTIVF